MLFGFFEFVILLIKPIRRLRVILVRLVQFLGCFSLGEFFTDRLRRVHDTASDIFNWDGEVTDIAIEQG
ncbi:MAG: hypothetical protein KDA60_00040, partial [Planctomycetales bacterium]|nr:hypothetical protein [Planctomycetales bacterium]